MNGMVQINVIFYDQIWNCSKYRERTAGVAATVNTPDKDDKVKSIYATQRC